MLTGKQTDKQTHKQTLLKTIRPATLAAWVVTHSSVYSVTAAANVASGYHRVMFTQTHKFIR